jgi:choline dehydrogenase
VESAAALGGQRNPNYNGASQDGVGLLHVNVKNGKRWSGADAFLRPARKRDNLDVVTGALVQRVTLSHGRAVAVEYERHGKQETARAEREIVLSAGAYGSPQLLMLSGIGPADHLREIGVEPRVDSASVGRHLQEHPFQILNWRCRLERTLDDARTPATCSSG